MDNKEELANRGKKAEAAVAKYLKLLKESDSDFDFARQYDARSAGGRFQSQVGDYLIFRPRAHAVLEVKTVAHDFRLPNKNFPADQIAKLRRREMAGSEVIVLIYHSTANVWRIPDFDVFKTNPTASSWNLSDCSTFAFGTEALDVTFPHLFFRNV
jgi:hypothetical protein